MRIFEEKFSPINTTSPINFLTVKNFEEVFFNVFEIELNNGKYLAEKVSEYEGKPVVLVPIDNGKVKKNYPFVLSKGSPSIIFNENNSYDGDVEIVNEQITIEEETTILDECLKKVEEEERQPVLPIVDNKDVVLEQIQKAKKEALKQIQLEQQHKLDALREEKAEKVRIFKKTLNSAKENLVNEFVNLSNKIKKDVININDSRFEEINKTIDNKIEDVANSLKENLDRDLRNSSKIIKEKLDELVQSIYSSLTPKIAEELKDIKESVIDRVDNIEKDFGNKVKTIGTRFEDVSKNLGNRVDVVVEGHIELYDKLNSSEKKIKDFYTEELKNLEEKTLELTEETRKYIADQIQETRDALLEEVKSYKDGIKSIEYIVESKGETKSIKEEDLIKDFDKKIKTKIDDEVVRLRKYVSIYSSGGGTNAKQFANGGLMEGDLVITGSISASQYLGIAGGSGDTAATTKIRASSANWDSTYITVLNLSSGWGGGSGDANVNATVRALSSDWQSTYTTVLNNSASWGGSSDDTYASLKVRASSANWDNTYARMSAWDSTNLTVYNLSDSWGLNDYLRLSGGTIVGDLVVTNSLSVTNLYALSANITVIDIKQYELSGFTVTGDSTIVGNLSVSNLIQTPTIGTHTNPVSTMHVYHMHFHPLTSAPTYEEGMLFYDSDDKTLSLYADQAGVALQIGQEMWVRVVNKTGADIPNGRVVYINGAQGNRPTIDVVDLNSFDAVHKTIGVTTQNIGNNNNGYVTTFGLVRDLNLSQFADGDILYLALSAGTLTNVEPSTPYHSIRIGEVVSNHATQGILLVHVDTGEGLSYLHDVSLSSLTNGDILSYNSSLSTWNNVHPTQWNSTHVTVNTLSSRWENTYVRMSAWDSTNNTVNSFSSNWQSAYNTVNTRSGAWDSTNLTVYNLSNGWENAYARLSAWDSTNNTVNALSSNWNSTYNTVNTRSGVWDSTNLTVYNLSNNWENTYARMSAWDATNNTVNSLSTNWNSAYSTTNTRSGAWDSTNLTVYNLSNRWENVYTDVAPNSASWNSTYVTVNTLSVGWQSTYTTVLANSSAWGTGGGDDTYASLKVRASSANWDSTYTTVLNNSALWGGAASNPVTSILVGNGITTVFTISGADNLNNSSALRVSIDGVVQTPEVDYTINNNIITFTSAISNGSIATIIAPNTEPVLTETFPASWLNLANSWTTEPTLSASLSAGDVYRYIYGSTIYYRYVPNIYNSLEDIFYATFNNPVLSNVVAIRGQAI
jgi:hypothetical protein